MENDVWKQIEGLHDRRRPLSDYFFTLFSEWGKRFTGLTPDFELMFERFEFLGSLAHLERHTKANILQELADRQHKGRAWMPVGRVGWDSANASKLIGEIQAEPMKAALMQAGFAKSDPEFIDVFVQNFKRFAERMQW